MFLLRSDSAGTERHLSGSRSFDYFAIIALPLAPEDSSSSAVHESGKAAALRDAKIMLQLLKEFTPGRHGHEGISAVDWLLSFEKEKQIAVDQARSQCNTRRGILDHSRAAAVLHERSKFLVQEQQKEQKDKVKAHQEELNLTTFAKNAAAARAGVTMMKSALRETAVHDMLDDIDEDFANSYLDLANEGSLDHSLLFTATASAGKSSSSSSTHCTASIMSSKDLHKERSEYIKAWSKELAKTEFRHRFMESGNARGVKLTNVSGLANFLAERSLKGDEIAAVFERRERPTAGECFSLNSAWTNFIPSDFRKYFGSMFGTFFKNDESDFFLQNALHHSRQHSKSLETAHLKSSHFEEASGSHAMDLALTPFNPHAIAVRDESGKREEVNLNFLSNEELKGLHLVLQEPITKSDFSRGKGSVFVVERKSTRAEDLLVGRFVDENGHPDDTRRTIAFSVFHVLDSDHEMESPLGSPIVSKRQKI